jgi:hypothetical protein
VFLEVITTLFDPLVIFPMNVPVNMVSFHRYGAYVPDVSPDGILLQVIVAPEMFDTMPHEQAFDVPDGVAVLALLYAKRMSPTLYLSGFVAVNMAVRAVVSTVIVTLPSICNV